METGKKGSSPDTRQGKKIIGSAYTDLKILVKKYAEHNIPVLFTGETGSGKEMFAQKYLVSSGRTGKKLSISCAGLPSGTLWSEVFGHQRGAFTGAVQQRPGRLRTCNNGILFIDEIGDASDEFQAAILRVAEGNSFSPLGSDEEYTVNIKLIAATNKPGNVREDLKQRFVLMRIPPLQKSDIPALVLHFLKRPVKKAVIDEMMEREYPGNVRELEKYCQKLYAEKGDTIFSDKDHALAYEPPPFEYDRYCREIEVWERHIEPLLRKYRLTFKYKFFAQPYDKRFEEAILKAVFGSRYYGLDYEEPDQTPKIDYFLDRDIKKDRKNPPGLVHLIEYLRHGLGEILEGGTYYLIQFMENLKTIFDSESLPFLLATIHRFETGAPSGKLYPSLSYLLDLPHAEATKKFEQSYLEFYIKQSKSQVEAARMVGLNPTTFRSRLSRLRKAGLSSNETE